MQKNSTPLDRIMKGPPKWTNEALANEVGKDPTYISQVRNGRKCSETLAKLISHFFNGEITPDEIQNPDNYMED